jgi:hypothetical protein
MKWLAAVVGALASALVITTAFANIRVVNDPGGEVTSYLRKYNAMRTSGERLVIDGARACRPARCSPAYSRTTTCV